MLSNTKIGSRIKECREYVKETQNDIAKVLSCSRQIVSYYENGKRMPNTTDLYLLSEHFGVSTDYLLGLSDVQTTNADTKSICEATGLSEKAVEVLNILSSVKSYKLIKTVNFFIESDYVAAITVRAMLQDVVNWQELADDSAYDKLLKLDLLSSFSNYLFDHSENEKEKFCISDNYLRLLNERDLTIRDIENQIKLNRLIESLKIAQSEFDKQRGSGEE